MRAAFRTDASIEIGIGHLMRCLTLAEELRARGVDCLFICREHAGHRNDLVRARGFNLVGLPAPDLQDVSASGRETATAYASWLGTRPDEDVAQTALALDGMRPDWLIVDHYALDDAWEKRARRWVERIMVIDDLADRRHDPDLLLDQNLGRHAEDYAGLVRQGCSLLIGPGNALLRPEFAQLRDLSLARRQKPKLEHIMVSMGGVDSQNATGCVVRALEKTKLPAHCRTTIVMGGKAPWLAAVSAQARQSSRPITVLTDVENMAQLMADSDLAIGAAGSTSWERCCLGLPSLIVVLAENQRSIAAALAESGAATLLGGVDDDAIDKKLVAHLDRLGSEPHALSGMSMVARSIADGRGASLVAERMKAMGQ